MKFQKSILAAFALVMLARSIASAQIQTAILPPIGNTTCHKEFDGNPIHNHNGYEFSVSPDEQWILMQKFTPGAPSPYTIKLLHQPTGKTWSVPIPALSKYTTSLDCFPSCFSFESDKIYAKSYALDLNPNQLTLAFTPDSLPHNVGPFGGYFLNFPGGLFNRQGKVISAWPELDQDEGAFGEVAWDYRHREMYEADLLGNLTQSDYYRRKSPVTAAVNFVHVFKAIDQINDAFENMMIKKNQNSPILSDTYLRVILKLLRDSPGNMVTGSRKGPRGANLSDLQISPDGELLAAIANSDTHSVGVVIPLNRGELIAYPFDADLYGKPIWGKSSNRIYYYAQDQDHNREGSVCSMDLTLPALQSKKAGPKK